MDENTTVSCEPKLIINLTEEEKELRAILKEVGADGLITLAQTIAPERDYTVNALEVAKDVIQNLIANGGQQMFCEVPNTPPEYKESPTGLSSDRVMLDY